jgi:hypothetical protein
MLVAKALSAFVIVGLVPVAVSVPWWLWCGFGVGQMAAAAGETLLILVVAMLPGALVAVLTDSLARAMLWTVALVAVVLFGGGFYIANMGREQVIVPLRLVATVLIITVELALVVAVQFHVRRRGWWLAAAAAVVMGTLGLATRGMWRSMNSFSAPREHDAALAADLRVQFHRAEAGEISGRAGSAPDARPVWQRVRSEVVVSGLPREVFVFGQMARQRWSWPGGPVVERLEPFYFDRGSMPLFGLKDAIVAPELKALWAEQLEKRTQRKFAPGEEFAEMDGWLQPSLVARMRKEPFAYEAQLWWQVARPELRLEVPLAPTRWTARGGHGIGIERIDRNPNFQLTFVATRPVLLMPLLRFTHEWHHDFEQNDQSWALLDRERGVVTYVFGERHSDKPRTLAISGVKIEWRTHFAAGPGKMREGKWVHDSDWRMGTSLAVFTLHDEAVVSRELKVEQYVLSK